MPLGGAAAPRPIKAEAYWESDNLGAAEDLAGAVRLAGQAGQGNSRRSVWRGQADATWDLHSSLSRHLESRIRSWPSEPENAR